MKSDRNQLLSIPVSSDLDNCYATHMHVHTHRHIQTCTHAEDLPPLLRSCRLPTLTLVYLNSESVNRLSHYLCPLLPQHILLSTTSCCIWRFSHSLCHTRTSRGGKQNKNKPRAPPPPLGEPLDLPCIRTSAIWCCWCMLPCSGTTCG